MDLPKGLTDILFYLAPALLVLATAFFLLKRLFDHQYKLKLVEVRLQNQKEMVPLRLQAYERLTLFLERVSLNNLLGRVYQPGLTVREFHMELLSTIRSEFEHNVTQQIYVSQEVWTAARNAREEIVKVINSAASSIDPDAKGSELSKSIFENLMKDELNPAQAAIDMIKNEVRQLY